jgi:hypothetical protein
MATSRKNESAPAAVDIESLSHLHSISQELDREVNERIRSLHPKAAGRIEIEAICECVNGQCVEPITVSLADYDQVRAFPTRFLVRPGHQTGFEEIVISTPEFVVIARTQA